MLKDNPIIQLLLAVIIFILGASLGGMYVKIETLQNQVKNGGTQVLSANAQQPAAGAAPVAPPNPTTVNVKLADTDPVMGDANAKVTITEFADYQCPFCGQFFKTVEAPLIKDYVNTGKVKFAFKDLAILGKESTDAANAALCAKEQNKFWEYHDYLYTNQGQENSGTFSPDNLKKFAVTLGLNPDQFNSCLDSAKYNAQVQADISEASALGFNSTPSIAVGSTPIVGAQPYDQFKTAIEAELAKK